MQYNAVSTNGIIQLKGGTTMKKTLIILLAACLVLPLSACGAKEKVTTIQNTEEIQMNKIDWQKNVNDLPIVEFSGYTESPGFIAHSMSQLKQANKAVVKGTVYNLVKMDSPHNRAYTKVIFHIDEVISGDKSLQDKTINLAMHGGVTTSNSWYFNKNQTREANHDIMVQYKESPPPQIGAQMIIGINPTDKKAPTEYVKALKKNHFDFNKTYDIGMPLFNTWIKNPDAKKYILNNPEADKKLADDSAMKQGMDKLTAELNK